MATKSAPLTPSATSSVRVTVAPLPCGQPVGLGDDLLGGPVRLRRDDPYVHAEQGAGDQVGVAHVEAGVAEVGEGDPLQRLVAVLGHGEDVGEHLGRVPVVGQPVEHRHAAVGGQLLHGRLAVTAVLDAVEHPAEDAGRVLHRLLVPQLGAGGVQIGRRRALVGGGHLEGAAGPGRGLLEDQRDVPAAQPLRLGPRLLGALELGRELDQAAELLGREVQLLEEVAACEVYGHGTAPGSGGDRAYGNPGSLYDTLHRYTERPPQSRAPHAPTPGRAPPGSSCNGGRPCPGRVHCRGSR